MTDIGVALIIAGGLSLVIGLTEIAYRSKAPLAFCLSYALIVYLLILVIGNAGTTLLASISLAPLIERVGRASTSELSSARDQKREHDFLPRGRTNGGRENQGTADLSATIPAAAGALWFWYAFVGVFGFEALLQNTNITLFGRGILSIEDWIAKARDIAEAAAISSHINHGYRRAQDLAGKLRLIPEKELSSHVLQCMGQEALEALTARAVVACADPRLVKALALAHERPDQAEAIVAARGSPTRC